MVTKEEQRRIVVRALCLWLDPDTGMNNIQQAHEDVDKLTSYVSHLEREIHMLKNPNWVPLPLMFEEGTGFALYDKSGDQVKQPKVGDKVFTLFISGMVLCTVAGTNRPDHLDSGGNISGLIERNGVLLGSGDWINKKLLATGALNALR